MNSEIDLVLKGCEKGVRLVMKTWKIPGLVLVMGILVLSGCGKKVTRAVDVSSGDYYTEEEFKNLSKDQRNAYCQELADEMARLESEGEKARSSKRSADSEISGLEGERDALLGRVGDLEEKVARLRADLEELENLPTSYTVIRGDCLWNISGKDQIYNDPIKWPRIYRANTDEIGEDPDLIYPDQVFTIPREWPDHYTVREDETLSMIASYWEVFGDPGRWSDIYEANRDQLEDPDMIYQGQRLKIPR